MRGFGRSVDDCCRWKAAVPVCGASARPHAFSDDVTFQDYKSRMLF
jgi:hypothetical protein